MAAPGENLRINGERLWDSLMEMAKIGPGIAGGNNRQTLTDEDSEGRHLFQKWCEAAGCTMGVDEIGNMFARRDGTDPDALPVYVGSHLDTQPTGGKYDGVLGVLGGLEILRTLNDLDNLPDSHVCEVLSIMGAVHRRRQAGNSPVMLGCYQALTKPLVDTLPAHSSHLNNNNLILLVFGWWLIRNFFFR